MVITFIGVLLVGIVILFVVSLLEEDPSGAKDAPVSETTVNLDSQ